MSSLQPAELSPIEQYAVKFMEKLRENLDTEALEAAEEDITIAKEEWELTHMQVTCQEEWELTRLQVTCQEEWELMRRQVTS